MNRKIIFVLFIGSLLILTNAAAQNTPPTLDKLFRQRWYNDFNSSDNTTAHIKDSFVFFSSNYKSAYDVATGKRKNFGEFTLQDSLAMFFPLTYSYIININRSREIEYYPNTGDFPINKEVRFIQNNKSIYRSYDKMHIVMDTIKRYATYSKWKFKSESEIFDKYYQDDSVLYVFNRTKLYELNYNTGVEIKVIDLNEKLSSTPIFENGRFYFITSTSGLNRKVWSIDVNTWKIKWTTKFEHFSFLLDLVHKDNSLYLVDNYGLNEVNKKTGELNLWVSGHFDHLGISVVRDYIFIPQHIDSEDVKVYSAINIESGEIKYRMFTSKGFPPVTEETMSEEAKEMRADGISGWREGLGYNRLDGIRVYFVEDPKTGLVIGNGNGFYCFEFIE